ncbi:hypothetical protein BLNAU_15825 [Blattamonas nauphoetae]|uniref:Uncharacterized protein n=1 Tax=Blattamonas nauphoetae TaxID=2049346 RepID=A0ABQ9X9J5_9EUKA|nr:hypothetical protein BLNAU_15825 [Blattamonas nauphoetae]
MNKERVLSLLVSGQGLLWENQDVGVHVKHQYTAGEGRVQLAFTNKTTNLLCSVSVAVDTSHPLAPPESALTVQLQPMAGNQISSTPLMLNIGQSDFANGSPPIATGSPLKIALMMVKIEKQDELNEGGTCLKASELVLPSLSFSSVTSPQINPLFPREVGVAVGEGRIQADERPAAVHVHTACSSIRRDMHTSLGRAEQCGRLVVFSRREERSEDSTASWAGTTSFRSVEGGSGERGEGQFQERGRCRRSRDRSS